VSSYDRDRYGVSYQMKSSYLRKLPSIESLPRLATPELQAAYCESMGLSSPEFWTHSQEMEEEEFDAVAILQTLMASPSKEEVEEVIPSKLFATPTSLGKVKAEDEFSSVVSAKKSKKGGM